MLAVINIVMALMAESATGRRWERLLRDLVLRPLRLTDTVLPSGFLLPKPFARGYFYDGPGALEDVSEEISVSSVWAAGGMVSSPRDLNRFIRAWALLLVRLVVPNPGMVKARI